MKVSVDVGIATNRDGCMYVSTAKAAVVARCPFHSRYALVVVRVSGILVRHAGSKNPTNCGMI
jgi:hypothetical protein